MALSLTLLAGDPVAVIFIAAGAIFASLFAELRQRSRWEQAGKTIGLELKGMFWGRRLTGQVEGYAVTVTTTRGKDFSSFLINLDGSGLIPRFLSLDAEGFWSSLFEERDIQTGHPDFDREARLFGNPAEVVALLDAGTREIVRQECLRGKFSVQNGNIELAEDKVESIPEQIQKMVLLAKRLTLRQADLPSRLARNSAEDPVAAVRLRNLTLLQETFPDHPETLAASRTALAAPEPELRLAAIARLGAEGVPAARELALDESASPGFRRPALQVFLQYAPPGQIAAVLEPLLASPPPELLPLLVEGAVRTGEQSLLDRLVALADRLDAADAVNLVRCIGRTGSERYEPGLLKLLDRPGEDLKVAVAEVLSRSGTIAAVAPLLQTAHRLTSPAVVKKAARDAIEQIQARLGDVERGRLLLASPAEPAGALSLAEGTPGPGALSLPEELSAPLPADRRHAHPASG